MLRPVTAALAAGAFLLATVGIANGESHSYKDRIETKLQLTNAVEVVCAVGVPECATLRTAAKDLYKDPLLVTQADLSRIDTLRAILAKYDGSTTSRLANARKDLAAAIERAEMVTNHVFFVHNGKWELFEICKMPV